MKKNIEVKYKYELTEAKLKMANSYLRIAFDTICNIQKDDKYVCELIDMDDEYGDDDSKYKVYERNFIISLASKFFENKTQLSISNLPGYVNGEVAKKLKINEFDDKSYLEMYIQIKRIKNASYKDKEQIHVFPDFLIHEFNSFDSINMRREAQHFIMEAKTTEIKDETKFWLDFLKLNFYIEKLKFDNAAYFILGTPLSRINTFIQNYMDDEGVVCCGNEINRLFLIVQETLKDAPKLYQIKKVGA